MSYANTAMAGYKLYKAGEGLASALGSGNAGDAGLSVSVTVGSQKAEQTQKVSQSTAAGSQVQAGNDVNLTAAQAVYEVDEAHQYTGTSSGLSSKTITTRATLNETALQGTTLSGEQTYIRAGNNIHVSGSNIVSTHATRLEAGGDIHIAAATGTRSEGQYREQVKSGLFSSGGIGFTIGTQEQSVDQQRHAEIAAASTVGATQGDVSIAAGKHYQQTGSNVLAPQGDIAIQAQTADIVEAQQANHGTYETQFKQSGLTVALTSPVIALIETAQQMGSAASQTSDDRMKVLAGATTALAASNAAEAVAADPQAGGGLSISITVGASKSQSKTTEHGSTAAGSHVIAGGDIHIRATGSEASHLTVQGSDIKGGNHVTLQSDGDINLLAASNTHDMRRDASSVSGAIGVAVNLGSNGVAFGLTVSASGSKGNAEGSDLAWTNTHVAAGNTLTLQSGGDANLIGATASGNQVVADIGGDLTIASLQDSSQYKSKDESIGGSMTIGYGFSASASYSQQKVNSNYASVQEQSGIFAGDGGFQVNVQGNTDLTGAVIASTDKAVEEGANRLTTGTLTQGEIKNRASYSASSVGLSGGYTSKDYSPVKSDGTPANAPGSGVGTTQQGQAATDGSAVPGTAQPSYNGISAAPPVALSASGSGRSTTGSGISGGAIQITDEARQKELTGQDAGQALASLDRSVTSGQDNTNALKPVFNEQEIQAGFEIVGALTREVGTFLNNRSKDLEEAHKARDEEIAKGSNADPARIAQLEQMIADNETWAPGGSARLVVTALTAAAGGNVTGTGTEMLQSAAAYYLQGLAVQEAKLIADSLMRDGQPTAESEAVRTALQGLVGCAGAAAQSQSCGAGASGAAAGVVLTNLVQALDGRDASKLDAGEREALTNILSAIVAGVTTAAGGDVAVTTAAAKIEIENNGVFIPVIMGAVWLADKGLTAYDVYQDVQAVKSGEKTLEQVAQEKGIDYVTGILVGNLAKHGVKVGSNAVKQITDKMAKNADGAAIAAKGNVANANFAQPKIRANEVFSAEGAKKYSDLAGYPINTVDDLANAIKSGKINPSQIPVDYVVTADGTKLILNTRTSVALDRAGIPKTDWYGTNQTGVQVPKMNSGVTFDQLALDQLKNNNLPSTGTPNMPTGGKK